MSETDKSKPKPKPNKRRVAVRKCGACDGHGHNDYFTCRLCNGVGQHIVPTKTNED